MFLVRKDRNEQTSGVPVVYQRQRWVAKFVRDNR